MDNATNQTQFVASTKVNVYRIINSVVIVFGCVALILNSLTLVALKLSSRKLQPHYQLVVNQCVVDMLFAASHIISKVEWTHIPFVFSLVNTSASLVLVNLFGISLEQFIAIRIPLRYKTIVTRRRIVCCIVPSYILLVIPLVHFAIPNNVDSKHKFHNGILIGSTIFFFVTCITMLVVYPYIFYKARRMARQTENPVSFRRSITSLWIVATFVLLYGIDGLLIVIYVTTTNLAFKYNIGLVRLVTACLPSLNGIIDPVIYAIRLPKVQKGFSKMCAAIRCRQTVPANGRHQSTLAELIVL